mgnify:CR=1 FL=1
MMIVSLTMATKKRFLLEKIFGDTVRIKVLEILLESGLSEEIQWLNISEIARIAGISTSSSKRIVDDLIQEGLADLHQIETHAQNPEKQVRLNTDLKIMRELSFFYRKLKGFL